LPQVGDPPHLGLGVVVDVVVDVEPAVVVGVRPLATVAPVHHPQHRADRIAGSGPHRVIDQVPGRCLDVGFVVPLARLAGVRARGNEVLLA
jgi:hypothetical protein